MMSRSRTRAIFDAETILGELRSLRGEGASRDDLLRAAVEAIERAHDDFDWVGIYLLEDPETLVLDAYVGEETEHDRIPVGRGVCGTAVAEKRDVNVPDVSAIENYLACSTGTRSELVLLIRDPGTGEIHGQLDLDSDRLDAFGAPEERELRIVADWLAELF